MCLGGALLVALVLIVTALPAGEWVVAAVGWVQGLGEWKLVVFVGVYIVLSIVALPTSPLNVAAGLLFGLLWGFIASLAGAMGSAIVAFLMARYLARGWIQRRLASRPRYAALLNGLRADDSFRMILLTRLNPILPSAVASYCFGVTPVKLRTYLLASLIGNAPLCLFLAYVGTAGHLTLRADAELTRNEIILYAAGFLATLALTVWVTWYTRRKLREYAHQPVQASQARDTP